MAVKLYTITYNETTGNGEPTAVSDARLYNFLSTGSGLVEGCEVTIIGGTQLHITSGWGLVMGRVFEVPEQDISATPASAGEQQGRLYLRIDVSDTDAPASLETIVADELPAPVQEDINDTGTLFELPLYEYTVTPLAASDLLKKYEYLLPTRAAVGTLYSCLLTADGWIGSAPYEQTAACVPVDGGQALTAETVTESPAFDSSGLPADTIETLQATLSTLLKGYRVPGDGAMTFYVYEVPQSDIEIYMRGRG